MKLLPSLFLCCLCLSVGGQARRLSREANALPDPDPVPQPQPAVDDAAAVAATAGNNDVDDDDDDDDDDGGNKEVFISDATTTKKPLGVVSIKSRAIAMDRGLCQEQSRYHPHYPKCHQYCKRLEHWIGQCWRESCHCIS